MTEPAAPAIPEILASFFQRMGSLEGILRIVTSDARLSAQFTFRGDPTKKVLLDLAAAPARVLLDEEARGGNIFMTIDGRVMHEILLGRMKPGLALGRREMLLRGCAMDFAKFIPLFDFGPVLYREHLADIGYDGFSRSTGPIVKQEASMGEKVYKGEPIPLVRLKPLERIFFKVVNGIAYGVGYLVGLLRYRLFEKLSLFEVLSAMSRGLEAASASKKSEPGRHGQG
jgi:hypothetical protein